MVDAAAEERQRKLAVLVLGFTATLLLSVAGCIGLKHAEIVLWATFTAGVCYAIAFYVAEFNTLSLKKPLTVSFVMLLTLLTVGAQIWLINRPRSQPSPVAQQVQTGSATTSAAGSPAVTGNGNSINVAVDSDAAVAKPGEKK